MSKHADYVAAVDLDAETACARRQLDEIDDMPLAIERDFWDGDVHRALVVTALSERIAVLMAERDALRERLRIP